MSWVRVVSLIGLAACGRIGFDSRGELDTGSHLGTRFDSARGLIVLGDGGGCDGSTTNCAELEASWAPQWASVVGYWRFDDGGSFADGELVPAVVGPDGMARNADGAGTSYAAGKLKQSIVFDHADGVDVAPVVESWPELTIAAWIRLPPLGNGNDTIFATDQFRFQAEGATLLFDLLAGDQLTRDLTDSRTRWVHVAVTWDGSVIRLYSNGVELGASIPSPLGPLAITRMELARDGVSGIGTDDPFDGSIDELAVWSKALSPAELAVLYDRQAPSYAGVFTSEVIDAGRVVTWDHLAWTTTLPFRKSLPTQSETSAAYPALATDTLMNGTVALWHFEETAPTAGPRNDIVDQSGQANHGEIVGNVALGERGRLGSALRLDGASGYVDLDATSPSFALTDRFTVSAWVRGLGAIATRGYIAVRSQYTVSGFRLMYDNVNEAQIHVQGFAGGAWHTQDPGVSIDRDRWVNLVVTFDSPTISLYINGQLVDSQNWGGPFTMDPAYQARIGTEDAYYAEGFIDECAMWNRALSALEVAQVYRRGANRISFQVRACDDAQCNGEPWHGDFSELDSTAAGSPEVTLSETGRYFQFRVILDSDDERRLCGGEVCSPELLGVTSQ